MGRLGRRLCELENHWLFRRPRQVIAELLQGQRVLDVCCGSGDWSAELAAAGCEVVGVDNSPTVIAYAREKRTTARFELMDATTLPFELEFDAAVISLALYAMTSPVRRAVLQSASAAVRPGGVMIALEYTVPRRCTRFSRLVSSLIDRDERAFLKSDPDHYRNFQEFMRDGGLSTWAEEQAYDIATRSSYWGGTVELVVFNQSVLAGL